MAGTVDTTHKNGDEWGMVDTNITVCVHQQWIISTDVIKYIYIYMIQSYLLIVYHDLYNLHIISIYYMDHLGNSGDFHMAQSRTRAPH